MTTTALAGVLAVVAAGCVSALVPAAIRGDRRDDVTEPPVTPGPAPAERRRLAAGWADLIDPPAVPELDVPGEPRAALVRPYVDYVGRHQEGGIARNRVAPGWLPPVGAARLRAALDDTAEMDPVEVDDEPEPTPGVAVVYCTRCSPHELVSAADLAGHNARIHGEVAR